MSGLVLLNQLIEKNVEEINLSHQRLERGTGQTANVFAHVLLGSNTMSWES